jgi:hypothetical protein
VAVVISAFVTIQPVLAQSSGVGCDGATRLLWKGTNLSISLWKLDSNLNSLGSVVYGPIDGWTPQGITTACNNNTYVLWLRTDGAISIWQVDANLNFVRGQTYGPFSGWIPESLSVDTTSNSTLRLIWRGANGASVGSNQKNVVGPNRGSVTNIGQISVACNNLMDNPSGGEVSIWYLQPDLSVSKAVAYGPIPGWQ